MLIQAHSFNPSPNHVFRHGRHENLVISGHLGLHASWASGNSKTRFNRRKSCGVAVSASLEQSSSSYVEKKRKVVEHISLLKAKVDLSEEEEKDMLDYLYTTQYQMGGILSISLGRISNRNDDKYTHAVYMRFQRKEELEKFYTKPFYLGVLKEHVLPYCHVCPDMDYSIWTMNPK